jgi:putative addiction module killer protein/probable addiction module antidote protein
MPSGALIVLKTAEFRRWLRSLRDERALARILKSIDRLSLGHLGNTKSVGGGISELRVDYGPGYRIYFARRGARLILLAYGGDKSRQKPILTARGKSPPHGSPKMGIETSRWDTAEFLDSPEAILAYLEAVFEDGDPGLIALALNNVARVKGLTHDALTAQSDISSLIAALKALGLELTAKAA